MLLALTWSLAAPGWAAPDPTHEQAIEQARSGRFEPAIITLRALHREHPYARNIVHDLITVHAWAGRVGDALDLLDALPLAEAPDYMLDAIGPALRRSGDALRALAAYQELARRYPGQREHAASIIDIARDLGAAVRAHELARQDPPALDPATHTDLTLDLAARHVRESHRVPVDRRDQPLKLAAETLDQAHHQAGGLPPEAAAPRQRRALQDRLVGLAAGRDWPGVVALHQRLVDRPEPLPPYVLAVTADAYLQLRAPQRAAMLYEVALADSNGDPEVSWETGHFYALLESDRWPEAWQRIESLNRRTPAFLGEHHHHTRRPNPDHVEVRTTRAMALAYGNRLADAESALQALGEAAPFDTGVRTSQAMVWLFRGRPNAAREALERVLTDAPDHLNARTWLAATHLQLGGYEHARKALLQVESVDPDYPPARRLTADLDQRRRWQLEAGARATSTRDDGRQGSDRTGLAVQLWTPALAGDRLQLGLGYQRRHGRVDGRRLDYHRQSVAVGFQGRGWDTRVGIDHEAGDGGLHPQLALAQRLGDAWSWRAALERHSWDRPLQAAAAGIRVHSVAFALHYHPDETLRLELAVNPARFSDGNRRHSLGLAGEFLLFANHRQRLTALAGLHASRNDPLPTPYFNPARGAELMLGLRWEQYIARHYERQWSQRLQGRAGRYRQSGHGWGSVWEVDYGHDWRLVRNLVAGVELGVRNRPYDGRNEQELRASLRLQLWF